MQPVKAPSFSEKALNNFQAWALQNPGKITSRALLPIISFVEGLLANTPTYLDSKRLAFGANFCCAGQVVLGEFQTLETALTSPQARTWRLGTSILEASHGPNLDVGGRNVFLIALSDEAAGGNGDREAFRKCMLDYILNEAARSRQQDAIARGLLDQLAEDYLALPHGAGGAFFTDRGRGLKGFMVKYLHYLLFGLDPEDGESVGLLAELYYKRQGTLYYFGGSGRLLGFLKLKELTEQAATIYENSPALANFQEGNPDYKAMTRRELAKLMTSIMSIAALQGPLHLAYTAMGYRPLPAYPGRETSEIDTTKYWDALDLEDRESVRLYLLECARLWAPVSATHRVAVEPFTAVVAGKERSFPAGTKVLIPAILGLLDESFWGANTYEFDAARENLCPYHMGFNSVGERSGGRICPGKDLALDMLVDIAISVGQVRRSNS